MSVDNRTTLNDCSSITGWTGDDAVTVITTTGDFYEGSSALSTQLSNSDEHMYTTSIGGTRDLSNAQIWNLIKDNLIETAANGGSQMVLHDGTNRIGYDVGGNDQPGLQLPTFYNSYRLDTSNLPANFTTFAGAEASLNQAATTGIGYGTIHLAKAVGSIDNVRMDRFSFIVNGSPALTINGGSSGTPETMSDVAADDVANGWGLVANLIASRFDIFCSTEWGDSGTADSYFSQSNAQLFFIGTGLGVGNFDMSLIGNATGTNSFVLDNCVCVNVDTRANWDFNVANFNTVSLTTVSWSGFGTFDLLATGGTYTGQTWDDCDRVNQNGATVSSSAVANSNDTTAFVMDDYSAVSDMSFTGNGIAIDATSAIVSDAVDLDGLTFSGNTTDVTVNSANNITINNLNGSNATTCTNTGVGTCTIQTSVTIELTNLIAGSRVYIRNTTDSVTIENAVEATTSYSTTVNYSADKALLIRVRNASGATKYKAFQTTGTLTANGFSLNVNQELDE